MYSPRKPTALLARAKSCFFKAAYSSMPSAAPLLRGVSKASASLIELDGLQIRNFFRTTVCGDLRDGLRDGEVQMQEKSRPMEEKQTDVVQYIVFVLVSVA